MLEIKNLHVRVDDKTIINNLSLTIRAGEIHAIMGPNGSGKSTLANALVGRPGYEVTSGSITYMGKDLLAMSPDERALAGLFLSFQYPVEIPGVNNIYLLKAAVNAKRLAEGEPELDAFDFLTLVRAQMTKLNIPESFIKRDVNSGFSGGEKKRNEILQMSLLAPHLAILDEIDSGLDIDALKTVAEGINQLRDPTRSMLMITHYQRLLDYIEPDFVHVLAEGQIVRSGDKSLAHQLEQLGYQWIHEPEATPAVGE